MLNRWPALQVDLRHYITGQQREQPAVDGDEHLVTVRHNKEDRHPDDDAGERPEHILGCGVGGFRLCKACRRKQVKLRLAGDPKPVSPDLSQSVGLRQAC